MGELAKYDFEYEVITDPRKIKAAQKLAARGYRPGKRAPHKSIQHAARTAGVNWRTIYLWLDDPNFIELIDDYSYEYLELAHEGMKEGLRAADPSLIKFVHEAHDPELFDRNVRALQKKYDLDKQAASDPLIIDGEAYEIPTPVFADSTLPDPNDGERPDAYKQYLPENFDDTQFTESSPNKKTDSDATAAVPEGGAE